MTTPPHTPPMAASNEAEPDQLEVARAEGNSYARALEAMDEESGAVTQRAGDYLVAFVQENAEGMYELEDGRLVWREAPEEANAHLEIAVADAADGRFVPALDITLTLLEGDRELFTTTMPFLWHSLPLPLRDQRQGPGGRPLHGAGADRPADLDASRPGQRQALRAAGRRGVRGPALQTGTQAQSGRPAAGRRLLLRRLIPRGQARGWVMLTIHGIPNRSVTMPNSSPHICFSRGIVTLPPSDSLSQ